MGQKVSPHGLRVGVIRDWDSKWYAGKGNFADMLVEDNKIRQYVNKKLYAAGVAKVLIERATENKVRTTILVARPGMVVGKDSNGLEILKKDIAKMTGKEVDINVQEVRRSELDAKLTAESVAQALEKRISFRRSMKQAIQRTMKAGAKGVKIVCAGRLGGAEIARSEKYSEGNVPLHTIRADIDYGVAEADTTYGKIGIKVWINHGEILDKGLQSPVREEKRERSERGERGDRRDNRRNRRDGERGERRTSRRDGNREGGERREGGNRQGGERRERRDNRDRGPVIPKAANQRIRPKKAEPAPEVEVAEDQVMEAQVEESQVEEAQVEAPQVEEAQVEEAAVETVEEVVEAAEETVESAEASETEE